MTELINSVQQWKNVKLTCTTLST